VDEAVLLADLGTTCHLDLGVAGPDPPEVGPDQLERRRVVDNLAAQARCSSSDGIGADNGFDDGPVSMTPPFVRR
jgi:hypothetical protein